MARYPSVEYVRFRTDGNAARKVEVAAPIKTMRLPRVKKPKGQPRPIDILSVTAVLMTIFMMALMAVGLWQLHVARQEAVAMQAKVERLQAENDALQAYYDEHLDLDQMERTAMAMGMIPREQATCITIELPQVAAEERPGAWERLTLFLAGLFA